jgi:hypothetical protein
MLKNSANPISQVNERKESRIRNQSVAIPQFDLNNLPNQRAYGGMTPEDSIEVPAISGQSTPKTRKIIFSSSSRDSSVAVTSEHTSLTPNNLTDSVLDLINSLNQISLDADEDLLSREYEARFAIAVVGTGRSGKEQILQKECRIENLEIYESSIEIIRRSYEIKFPAVVEYWNGPENTKYLSKTTKCLSGLAGTIFFIDVTDSDALTDLGLWLDALRTKRMEMGVYGHIGVLIANKIDQTGRRVIFSEAAQEFAKKHQLDYYECSPSDEPEVIHEIFHQIISKIIEKVPESSSKRSRLNGTVKQVCPIGLQWGLALPPASKFKYKQRLKAESFIPTSAEVDWLTDSLLETGEGGNSIPSFRTNSQAQP